MKRRAAVERKTRQTRAKPDGKPEGKPRSERTRLAETLGVDRSNLHRYLAKGMPLDEAGAREWLSNNVKSKARPGKVVDAVLRLNTARAELAELEAAERRGELIRFDEVERWARGATVAVTSQLEGLPGRMAATLAGMSDPAEVRQALLDEVRRIRVAFAEALRALVPADGGLGDATADEDARRVGRSVEAAAAG